LAQLIYSGTALADLERLADFLIASDPVAASRTVDLIVAAVETLRDHPLIGRPVEHGLRELIISRGRSGYVALYSVEDSDDAVLVLSLRHQREAGYSDEQGP
jgi:addiction module RelE/StbE family toxin